MVDSSEGKLASRVLKHFLPGQTKINITLATIAIIIVACVGFKSGEKYQSWYQPVVDIYDDHEMTVVRMGMACIGHMHACARSRVRVCTCGKHTD